MLLLGSTGLFVARRTNFSEEGTCTVIGHRALVARLGSTTSTNLIY